ncbi:hypothetical protein [Streptomyces sp. NPDC048282]
MPATLYPSGLKTTARNCSVRPREHSPACVALASALICYRRAVR